jgi:hypothetical protein
MVTSATRLQAECEWEAESVEWAVTLAPRLVAEWEAASMVE